MVKAKGEADGLLACASSRGDLDIVISGDMDLLAMGTVSLWTPIEDGYQFREYVREEILKEINLTDWQFRSMCAVCFTEASQEQNQYDIYQAYQMMKVFKSLDVLRRKYPNWLTICLRTLDPFCYTIKRKNWLEHIFRNRLITRH